MSAGKTLVTSVLVLMTLQPDQLLAESATRPTIALLGVGASPAQRGELQGIQGLLEKAIAGQASLVSREELLGRRAQRSTDQERALITELREAARRHLLDFEFDQARQSLEEARRRLLEQLADVFGDRLLGEVDLDLARVLLDQQERQEALELMVELASQIPEVEPSADDYPPRLLEAWEQLFAEGATTVAVSLPNQRLIEAGAALGVSHVVTGSVNGPAEGPLTLGLSLISTVSGALLNEGRVTLGAREDWPTTLGAALGRLLRPLQPTSPPAPATGQLLVLSVPTGAAVTVDGDLREGWETPLSLEVSPGLHTLTLSREGYRPAQVAVTVWQQQTHPVEVELEPLASRANIRRRWWLWAFVGFVAAGAAAGLIAWGVLEDRDQPDLIVNIVQALTADSAGSGRR